MRRKDRQVLDFKEIYEIIERCDVCRIALNNDGYPYMLPLNFGISAENEKLTIYFHKIIYLSIFTSHNFSIPIYIYLSLNYSITYILL